MSEVHGLMDRGQGHPRSRDWALPEFPCKRMTCVCNLSSGRCLSPARCEIDKEGKCVGYKPTPTKKKENNQAR